MRIDKTHRSWMNATLFLFAIATVGYIIYALTSVKGPSGGSAMGLIYGIAGYGMMLYAGLLGARKKRPIWRVGKAQTWMRRSMRCPMRFVTIPKPFSNLKASKRTAPSAATRSKPKFGRTASV